MDHIAIDLGGRESHICVRSGEGSILKEFALRTSDLPKFLETREKSRVVVETCAESFHVADAALELGHEVRVVPATLVPALGVGARKTKNDKRDCRILSEASCRIDLPSVHIPSALSRERKTRLSMHDALVGSRTKLVNAVRGWLRQQVLSMRAGAVETFPKRVRAAVDGELPREIERVLTMLDELTKQILEDERELAQEAKKDPVCRLLQSVPGVGPMTSLAFVAAVDTLERFPDAHKLEAYLGLVPGEHSSSGRQQRLSITKAGPPRLRWLLIQASWTARRVAASHPMGLWSLQVEQRRGKRMAAVALARKMAGILFAMWRDGTFYDREHGAKRESGEARGSLPDKAAATAPTTGNARFAVCTA
jgi:transposase